MPFLMLTTLVKELHTKVLAFCINNAISYKTNLFSHDHFVASNLVILEWSEYLYTTLSD